MSRLVVITEGLPGLSHELGTHWVTIGRAPSNVFQIVETSISSQHCEVRLRDNELVVRDLRSTNGTYINGKTISEAVLQPGQTLRLGQVELKLELSPSASLAAPPKPAPAPADDAAPAPAKKTAGKKVYRVLFVDDSMAFLEMVIDLFSSREDRNWEIHTASSPDKALTVLQQKLIDLVVLDVSMPLLDGAQLLGLIHQRYPNIKKVVLTGESDDSHRASCLAGGAELYLLKPGDEDGWRLIFNMLSSLLQWEDHDDFVSTLSETGLYNVIQLECLGGNSSVVEVRNPQTAGEVYIESGAIVHAAAGRLAGEKAFHQLLSLTDGEFRVIPFRPPPERTVQRPWEQLLSDATRLRKEENYSSKENETILITKKSAARTATAGSSPAPAATPAPATPTPDKPAPARVPRNTTSGMNILSWEEMVEADTELMSKPDGNPPPPGDSKT